MIRSLRDDRLLAIVALCTVLPLFAARHLPMPDLPEHVAVMATFRHWWDPAWHGHEYFELSGALDTQYWLYHVTGAGLAAVLGSAERANLLLMVLVGLAYPYALRMLLRALGADERLAVFGAPLFWSRAFTVGLLNFAASVPVLLAGLALAVRQAEAPTRRRSVLLVVVSIALFYLHLSSFLLFASQATVVALLLPRDGTWRRRLRALPRQLLWLAPAIAIAGFVAVHGSITRGPSEHGMTFTPNRLLLGELGRWMFDTFRSPIDEWIGVGLLGTLVLGLALGRAEADEATRHRQRVAVLLVGLALFFFFALPATVGGFAGVLDVRMAVFVGVLLPTVVRLGPGLRAKIPVACGAVLSLALAANAAWEIHAFERDEVGRFDELLRGMPRGKRLLMLNFDEASQHVYIAPFTYFGAYYRARYGGVASFSFTELGHWPIHYRAAMAPPAERTWGRACMFRNARDGAYFDYVLTHGEKDPFAADPPGPRWEVVGASRAWKLYAKVRGSEHDLDEADLDRGPCAPDLVGVSR